MTEIQKLISNYPVDAVSRVVKIRKPDGRQRTILSPSEPFNLWLKLVLDELNKSFNKWPPYVHGGIRGRGVKTFAKIHTGKRCLITIDIRNCFNSIKASQVADALSQFAGLDAVLASELSVLLTDNGRLAQGFATSNFLSNLYLLTAFGKINQDLTAEGLDFSVYIDDLAISGDIKEPDKIINIVAKQLSRSGLAINKLKVKVMYSNRRQEICGVVVNKKLSFPKQKKRDLEKVLLSGSLSQASYEGWYAYLFDIDPKFAKTFKKLAVTAGYK
jgi:RNA-directed DNA polymerase